jgi:hypothetical protein
MTSAARFGRSLALPPLSVALWLRAIVLLVVIVLGLLQSSYRLLVIGNENEDD